MVEIEGTNWRKSGNTWETDVEPDTLRLATLTHAEMATDRYCRQIASVVAALSESRDPHWAAVTCYYAALYAAQALLLQSGAGALRVPQMPGVPFRGVLSISLQPSTASVGRTTVLLTPVRGGSHRVTWDQTVTLIDEILAFETDARAILVLETLKQEIRDPDWLSDARNEINYDLTSSPFAASIWSSLLTKANDPEELEDELARSVQERVERRFEVVAMALGRLSAQLRDEHRRRGGRIDRRQMRARLELLPSHSWLVQHEQPSSRT